MVHYDMNQNVSKRKKKNGHNCYPARRLHISYHLHHIASRCLQIINGVSSLQITMDSDYVWESFLLTDYQQIISSLVSPSSSLSSLSKKDLYLHLCYNPILINNGTMVSILFPIKHRP